MREPTRLGVVGPGLMWHKGHKHQLLRLKDHFEVTLFCARTSGSLDKALEDFPDAMTTNNYQKLVESPEIDAVLVVTPIPLNAPVSIAALQAGKDVYLEKPMATSVEEARQLLDAERKSEGRLFVLENALFTDLWDDALKIFESGEVGKVVMFDKMVHVYLNPHAGQGGYESTEWRTRCDFPLGIIWDGGIHDIACFTRLFGTPISVYSLGQNLRPECGEYDNINTLFEFPDGVIGSYSHSGLLGGNRNYFYIRGTEGSIEVSWEKLIVERKNGEQKIIAPPDASKKHLLERMWDEMAELRQSREKGRYTPKEAAQDLAVLEAIANSLHSKSKALVERI